MKPVYQDITDPGKGNCYSACLASLLEISLETVPNFRRDFPQREFNERIQEWLERFGLTLLRVRLRDADGGKIDLPFHHLLSNTICIASGKSPRGSHGHAVVGQITGGTDFEMFHDPNAEAEVKGLDELWTLDFLVPHDPAKIIRRIQVGD